jgi:hypothetical protein
MKCAYCDLHDATADSDYCADCREPMREAFALLFAGLAELFLAHREQETRGAA